MFSTIQIILFIVSTGTMAYAMVASLVRHYGNVYTKAGLRALWVVALGLQIAFLLALTQGWGK